MKKSAMLLSLLVGCIGATAQNIGFGTSSPQAKLHIKGDSNLTHLIIDAHSAQKNSSPMIVLRKADGTDIMDISADAQFNTFVGLKAGRNSSYWGDNNTFIGCLSGQANTHGRFNTALGTSSLSNNLEGNSNTAIGNGAMLFNTNGGNNVAVGSGALTRNTTGGLNTAVGPVAMYENLTGSHNTAVGFNALRLSVAGIYNVAVGENAMYTNTGGSGAYNTAVGNFALSKTTNSQYNTTLGYNAGSIYNLGYNNTLIGAGTDGNFNGQYNCVAIGQAVRCTDHSMARIGNSATWSIGGYAGWSNLSDGRYKKDVQYNVPGLPFIMKLQPVTYHLDVAGISEHLGERTGIEMDDNMQTAIDQKEAATQTGFIAQDVEAAAKALNYDFSGVDKPRNEKSLYALRYSEFVVPLVKAVQEQQAVINELVNKLAAQQKQIDLLLSRAK